MRYTKHIACSFCLFSLFSHSFRTSFETPDSFPSENQNFILFTLQISPQSSRSHSNYRFHLIYMCLYALSLCFIRCPNIYKIPPVHSEKAQSFDCSHVFEYVIRFDCKSISIALSRFRFSLSSRLFYCRAERGRRETVNTNK